MNLENILCQIDPNDTVARFVVPDYVGPPPPLPADDLDGTHGEILYDQTDAVQRTNGVFGFIEVSATSKPIIGDFGPQLELEVEADSDGEAGILIIEASDTGYSLGDISSWTSFLSANAIITPNVKVEIESWWDPDNILFAQTNQLYLPDDPDFVFENAASPFEAFADDLAGLIDDGSSPFSMTTRMTITHFGGQDFTEAASRIAVNPVPVPASLPLLIGALGIAGAMVRRSRAKS